MPEFDVAAAIACKLMHSGHEPSDDIVNVPCPKMPTKGNTHGRGRSCQRCGYYECMGCVGDQALAEKRKGVITYKEFYHVVTNL